MTRKEEILQAARDYVGSVTFSSPSDVIHFENGAKWADEHPNLESLWQDAHEEPQGEYKIICQDEFEHVWLTDWREVVKQHASGWEEYAECECIVRWAYVSDIMPKGGGR